ncbi:hypothetical protein HYH03_017022 [Edaphochlamys debaryana]|uniref:Uncharacterized protein n=1 Tax=Edaphochlamys debaryana TaxID=47281 RepID=A0A835XIR0_9CHLO|nr:hypothetical protein HYH03_017022 [Edaphochlamys debaryana]|eukprot:KAG2484140.1 hypothetical protein HYH03_017022 [Edaphochlamys debaryana]
MPMPTPSLPLPSPQLPLPASPSPHPPSPAPPQAPLPHSSLPPTPVSNAPAACSTYPTAPHASHPTFPAPSFSKTALSAPTVPTPTVPTSTISAPSFATPTIPASTIPSPTPFLRRPHRRRPHRRRPHRRRPSPPPPASPSPPPPPPLPRPPTPPIPADCTRLAQAALLSIPSAVNSSFIVAAGLSQPSASDPSAASLSASFCAVCSCALRLGAPGTSRGPGPTYASVDETGGGTGGTGVLFGPGASTTAEWLVDAEDGIYTLTLEMGGLVFTRTVVVDRTPPSVAGTLTLGDHRIRQEPAALTEASLNNVATKRAVLLKLSFSEPVPLFDPRASLLVTGAVLGDWAASPDNTTFWVLALSMPQLDTASPDPTVQDAAAGSSGNGTKPGVQVVQFHLPPGSYFDAARNPGRNGLTLSAALEEDPGSVDPNTAAALSTSATVGAAFYTLAVSAGTVAMAASSSAAQLLRAKGSMMQGSYHVQILSMSLYLASPGVGREYGKYAVHFRYAILGVKGNLGAVDEALPAGQTNVTAADQAHQAAGPLWPVEQSLVNASTLPAPPPPNDGFVVTVAPDRPAAPPGPLSPSAPRPPPLAAGVFAVGADGGVGGGSGSGIVEGLAAASLGELRPPPPPQGGAGSGRRRSAQSSVLSGAQPPPAQPPSAQPPPTANNEEFVVSELQNLQYTLAIAAILLAIIALLRLLAAIIYKKLVSPELHPFLAFPRIETTFAGLLLVALTFYASMALGGPFSDWSDSRIAAYCVLTLLVVPYGVFLWWLALARAWMVPQYAWVEKLHTSIYASPRASAATVSRETKTSVKLDPDLYPPYEILNPPPRTLPPSDDPTQGGGADGKEVDGGAVVEAAAGAGGFGVDGGAEPGVGAAAGAGGATEAEAGTDAGVGDMYAKGPHWSEFVGVVPPPPSGVALPPLGAVAGGAASAAAAAAAAGDGSDGSEDSARYRDMGPHWRKFSLKEDGDELAAAVSGAASRRDSGAGGAAAAANANAMSSGAASRGARHYSTPAYTSGDGSVGSGAGAAGGGAANALTSGAVGRGFRNHSTPAYADGGGAGGGGSPRDSTAGGANIFTSGGTRPRRREASLATDGAAAAAASPFTAAAAPAGAGGHNGLTSGADVKSRNNWPALGLGSAAAAAGGAAGSGHSSGAENKRSSSGTRSVTLPSVPGTADRESVRMLPEEAAVGVGPGSLPAFKREQLAAATPSTIAAAAAAGAARQNSLSRNTSGRRGLAAGSLDGSADSSDPFAPSAAAAAAAPPPRPGSVSGAARPRIGGSVSGASPLGPGGADASVAVGTSSDGRPVTVASRTRPRIGWNQIRIEPGEITPAAAASSPSSPSLPTRALFLPTPPPASLVSAAAAAAASAAPSAPLPSMPRPSGLSRARTSVREPDAFAVAEPTTTSSDGRKGRVRRVMTVGAADAPAGPAAARTSGSGAARRGLRFGSDPVTSSTAATQPSPLKQQLLAASVDAPAAAAPPPKSNAWMPLPPVPPLPPPPAPPMPLLAAGPVAEALDSEPLNGTNRRNLDGAADPVSPVAGGGGGDGGAEAWYGSHRQALPPAGVDADVSDDDDGAAGPAAAAAASKRHHNDALSTVGAADVDDYYAADGKPPYHLGTYDAAGADAGGAPAPPEMRRLSAAAPLAQTARRRSSILVGYRRKADCCAPWLLPSERLMARFEFLFEDVLGPNPEEHLMRAQRPARLIATALNFTHKVACAALLGALGLLTRSDLQLGGLIAVQVIMLAYLCIVWPYAEWQLQALEVVCHGAELGLFVAALAVAGEYYSKPATFFMIVCFFLTLACLIAFEIRKIVILIQEAWRTSQERFPALRRCCCCRRRDDNPTANDAATNGPTANGASYRTSVKCIRDDDDVSDEAYGGEASRRGPNGSNGRLDEQRPRRSDEGRTTGMQDPQRSMRRTSSASSEDGMGQGGTRVEVEPWDEAGEGAHGRGQQAGVGPAGPERDGVGPGPVDGPVPGQNQRPTVSNV